MFLNNPAAEAEMLMRCYNNGLVGPNHPLLFVIQEAVFKLDVFDGLCDYEELLCNEIGEDGFYVDNTDKLNALELDIQEALYNREEAFKALVQAIKTNNHGE